MLSPFVSLLYNIFIYYYNTNFEKCIFLCTPPFQNALYHFVNTWFGNILGIMGRKWELENMGHE